MAVIGKRNVVAVSSNAGSWELEPGNAASEVATKPVTNLDDHNAFRYWESADATVGNTQVYRDTGESYRVLAASVESHNIGKRGQYQLLLDDRWCRRWYLDVDGFEVASTADITPSADFTIELWVRFKGDASDFTANGYLLLLGNALGNSTTDVNLYVNFSNQGNLRLDLPRYSGSANTAFNGSNPLLDKEWHHIAITYNDTSDMCYVYVDFSLAGSAEITTPAPVGQTVEKLTINDSNDNYDVADVRYWTTDLTLAQIVDRRCKVFAGAVANLQLNWQFDEGTGTAIVDSQGNHDGTATGGTWDIWTNPHAAYDSGVTSPWGPWKRRRFVRYDGSNDYSSTDDLLASTYSFGFALWLRVDPHIDVSNTQTIAWFGDGSGAANTEWALELQASTGSLRFAVSRYTSYNYLAWVADLRDGEWHRVLVSVDGGSDEMSIWVDGEAHASNGQACDAFGGAARITERLVLAAENIGSNKARVDVAGPVIAWNVAVDTSDDYPYHDYPPENRLSMAGYYQLEDGSGDEEVKIDNRGSWGASGDFITTDSAGTPNWTGMVDAAYDLPIVSPFTVLPTPRQQEDGGSTSSKSIRLRLSAEAVVQYVGFRAWDPDAVDGAVRVGAIGVWESASIVKHWGEPSIEDEMSPMTWTASNVAVRGLGTPYRSIRVSLEWATPREASEARYALLEAAELRRPTLLLLFEATEARVYWDERSVYGVPIAVGKMVDKRRGNTGAADELHHGFEVVVRQMG